MGRHPQEVGLRAASPVRWLITGGCGFIGSALVRALAADGDHALRIVDDLSTGSTDAVPRGVEIVRGDVRDADLARRASSDVDVIVHLAANTGVDTSVRDPLHDCTTNVLGTFTYLDAARHSGVKRFVFASSSAPLGEVEPPIHEELAAHPISPYGASKLAGEAYCSAFARTFGVGTVALRFGNVYGPGSGHKHSVVAKFIRRALAGQPLEIYGDGTQTRDFVFIGDLIDAIRRAAASTAAGEVIQIATERETTVGDIAERIGRLVDGAGLGPVTVIHMAPRVGDMKRSYSDIAKARRLLGWSPRTSLDEGLRQTLEWFLAPATR
jgi:UDP-glucose 4-epimerase